MRLPISITQNFLLEPVLATFGVTHESSFVELTGSTLHVKMGGWFDETFPVAQIASVAPSDWPWWGGLGVKLHHHGVGVVGSLDGVVNLRFATKVKARVLLQIEIEQIWISLVDRDAFMHAVADAAKIPVAPHSPF